MRVITSGHGIVNPCFIHACLFWHGRHSALGQYLSQFYQAYINAWHDSLHLCLILQYSWWMKKKKKVENRSLLSADSNQSRQCTKMVTYVQTNECIAEVKEGRETIHLWRLYEHPDFWGCLEIMVSRLPKVRCFYEYKQWNNIWISKILWVHFQQPHLTVLSALGHILICGKPSYKC